MKIVVAFYAGFCFAIMLVAFCKGAFSEDQPTPFTDAEQPKKEDPHV